MSGDQDDACASTSSGPPPAPAKGFSGKKTKLRRGKPAKNRIAIKNAKIEKITTKPAEKLVAPDDTKPTDPEPKPTVPEPKPIEFCEPVEEVEKNTVEVGNKPVQKPKVSTKLKTKNRKKRNQKSRNAKGRGQPAALPEPAEPEPGCSQAEPEPGCSQAEPEPGCSQAEPEPGCSQAEPEPDAGEPEEAVPSYSEVAQVEPEPGSAQPKPPILTYSAIVKPFEERLNQIHIDACYPYSDSDSNDYSNYYQNESDDDEYWEQDYELNAN